MRVANVLVVDDDAAVRGILERILVREGHQAFLAANGREAIDAVGPSRFDLIITDINMPDMNGIELILELEGRCPGVPVLAISGGGLIDARSLLEDARHLGAVEIIEKPFLPGEILSVIDRTLSG